VTATEVGRAGRREWIGLAVLALACLLYAMDLTVLHLAVPSLSADLQPSSSQLLWITDIYGFMVAGFLVTMGTLGDRIGRRRLLLLGAAVLATVLLREVAPTAQAEPGEPPTTAAEPAAVAQPEEPEPVQVIRSGSGCLACPGERRPTELPRFELPKPLPDNPSPPPS